MVRLKEVCDVDWGNTNLTKSAYVDNGKYLGVSAGGCDGRMDYYDFEAFTPVISAIGANCGKLFLPTEPFVAIKNTITLNPHKGISGKYIYYALLNNHIPHRGGGQPFISKSDTEEYMIYCPTLVKQQEIVLKFDKVENLISCRKQQLSKLDELVKTRFIELFGDPVDNPKNYLVKSLQELIDMGYITYHLDGNHGGDYPRSEEFVDSGVPYIGANSIVNGKIDFSMAKFLTAERAGKLRKGIAQNDDVLFAHNATVGPTVVLKTTEPKVILSTSLTAYRCDKSRLLPNYLKAYMQSDGFVRQYSGEMKQTTRNQVPITAQKKYLFLVPPIVEQKQLAVFVEQTDKSKLAIQESLAELETLKKALMQKYFG